MTILVRVLFSAFLLCCSYATFGATTALYFKSDPGDYIGAGQEKLYLPGDFTFYAYRNYHNGVSVGVNGTWPNWEWWTADFAAPGRVQLAVGTYENAVRFPFQGFNQAGLSFSGSGRGCNTLTGRFVVLEAVYDEGGQVISFAADFEQHCEGMQPALRGEVRYNSSIPISAMTPAKIKLENPLNSAGCVEATGPQGAVVTVSGQDSRDSQNGTNLSYLWEISSGVTSTDPRFSFNLGVNDTTTVKLTITDLGNGKQSSALLKVCVSDTAPPVVRILSPVEGETMVGDGVWAEVSVTDAVDKNIRGYSLFLGASASVPLDASGNSRVRMLQGQPGTDAMMLELRATATDASGNAGSQAVHVYKAHDARTQ